MPKTTPTHREFSDDRTPLAYLITFRSYGTWLHGDSRGSVDRLHNAFGTPRLSPNPLRRNYERRLLKRPPVKLTAKRRAAIERGIRDTCKIRKWLLWAFNIRTNHGCLGCLQIKKGAGSAQGKCDSWYERVRLLGE